MLSQNESHAKNKEHGVWKVSSQKLEGKIQKYNSKFKTDLKSRRFQFSLDLIDFIYGLPNQRGCWINGDQVLRSGTSVGASLIEARAASSRLEFKKFHETALKSANETKYWLGLLRDSGKGNRETVGKFLSEVIETANMIAAEILKLKGKTNL